MKDKLYTVYKHIAPNGKIYIGQTCQNLRKRWGRGSGYKNNPYFYSAIQKYGWDNFEHVIIADGLTNKEANWLEKYLIAYYETTDRTKGYNHTKGGDGSLGVVISDETRKKMSESHKGKSLCEEQKKRISEANKGRKKPPRSEEHCRKISELRKNNPQPRDAKGHFIKSA